jgi:hypothetical protein
MFTRHVSSQLARFADGDLDPREQRRVEAHLAKCDRCRRELEDFRFAAGLMRELTAAPAPDSVWRSVEQSLAAGLAANAPARLVPRVALAGLALATVVVLALVYVRWEGSPASVSGARGSWDVVQHARDGAVARLAAGTLIDTDRGGRVTIRVGSVGTVDVEPGTLIRLGDARPDELRLILQRGSISARVTAPPRLFIVDTPASTVVDLGCAYTMTMEDDGTGELRVTEGWTALEWNGRESLVPAGANALTRPDVGPGTPYFADASPRLQAALERFDFGDREPSAVEVVMAEARTRDTLTLWHLLSRVTPELRARVYDRIAALAPPPASVSREQVLGLDPAMLTHWREELAWTW